MHIYHPSFSNCDVHLVSCLYVLADQSGAEVLTAVDHLVKQVSEDSLTLDEALSSDSISQLQVASVEWSRYLTGDRTAKLWLMYMTLVSILRAFIRAGYGLMCLLDKVSLQAALIKKVPLCVIRQYPNDVVYVLGGGALLQNTVVAQPDNICKPIQFVCTICTSPLQACCCGI